MGAEIAPGNQDPRVNLYLTSTGLVLIGEEARRVAARLVPLADIEECGGPDRYLSWAARTRPQGLCDSPRRYARRRIRSFGARILAWAARNPAIVQFEKIQPIWLGVEMAVNEENERHRARKSSWRTARGRMEGSRGNRSHRRSSHAAARGRRQARKAESRPLSSDL